MSGELVICFFVFWNWCFGCINVFENFYFYYIEDNYDFFYRLYVEIWSVFDDEVFEFYKFFVFFFWNFVLVRIEWYVYDVVEL